MKRVIRKPYWNFEKEETWINDMAAEGWALTNYTWCKYEFEECEKGEYIYRIELLEKTAENPESKKYIEFLEDTGIEHIASYMRWIYIRKRSSEGEFGLFSDTASKLKHYRRVNSFWLTIGIANFTIGLNNINIGLIDREELGIIKLNLIAGICCTLIGILLFFVSSHIRKRIRELKRIQTLEE